MPSTSNRSACASSMLRAVMAALKPGGRFAIVEPAPMRAYDTTRAAQAKRHTIAMALVEEDLRQAGFEIAVRDAAFTTRPDHKHEAADGTGSAPPVEWLLVVRKPADR